VFDDDAHHCSSLSAQERKFENACPYAAAARLYQNKFQAIQGGAITLVVNCDWREPQNPDSPEVGRGTYFSPRHQHAFEPSFLEFRRYPIQSSVPESK
jgi:hypothetical protein